MRIIPLLTALLCLTIPASAQDYEGLLKLPEGATLMNVSATERTEVKQDLLTATLRYEFEDANTTDVQNKINETMASALNEAKKVSTISASTLGYSIYQYDLNQGKANLAPRIVWRGEQSMQIKSTDNEAVLKLAGELQKMGLLMNGLGFSVSTTLRDETQSALLEKALARLTAKAERAGKALGKTKIEMLQVTVGQDGGHYAAQPMMMRSMEMDGGAKMAAPVAEAGESEITLSVDAVALLK
jgi:predicted secreted protein